MRDPVARKAHGDARIVLDSEHHRNRYYSAPWPQDVLAYASSTANDISPDAFAHVGALGGQDYAAGLESLRQRIRAAYGVADDVAIVFAPSGTDLEFVALACAGDGPLHNVLLGADEVGSGCIHSAHGRFFAQETALGIATTTGDPVPGLGERVTIEDVPVRDSLGHAYASACIRDRIEQGIEGAGEAHALVHVVHGSKTGLILPLLEDIDDLVARHGERITLVVDACQARITSAAIADYLKRERAYVEAAVHRMLDDRRVSGKREFFRCNVATARQVIEAAAGVKLGRHWRTRPKPARRAGKGRRGYRGRDSLPALMALSGVVLVAGLAIFRPPLPSWLPGPVLEAFAAVEGVRGS